LLSGDSDDTNQIPGTAGASYETNEDTGIFYEKAQIRQLGSQLWLELDEDIFVGTIAANGDFTLLAMNADSPTEISGNYDGSSFTGFVYTEPETVSSATCNGKGTLAMEQGREVSEELVLVSGIPWFESDSREDSSGKRTLEFFLWHTN
jgi:hypothetical protein